MYTCMCIVILGTGVQTANTSPIYQFGVKEAAVTLHARFVYNGWDASVSTAAINKYTK